MTSEIRSEVASEDRIREFVRRAKSLYSLPKVAAEVIQLTDNPKVDALALKECIQTDPALTAKLLRVVNSSLFGLSREVTDLNQALALLGIKPLKLLVLGFSLPENMFARVARQQLHWYWSTTLARAVAAREISEQLYERPGDDAFLAGLLQDVGVLVLLGQLKEPYAEFLGQVIEERIDLRRVEVESLGFDHLALTAALLEHWNMPSLLVNAIAAPRDCRQLAKNDSPHGELARVLHLAELLAELVAHNRLSVLPDLLEAGDLYCGIDKQRLTELVESLQPKTEQLAEVMSLDLPEGVDYADVITAAHAQMSELAESIAEPLTRATVGDEAAYDAVLSDAAHLRSAVDEFLQEPTLIVESTDPVARPTRTEVAPAEAPKKSAAAFGAGDGPWSTDFPTSLTLMVGQSRSRRQPVSVVLLEVQVDDANDTRLSQLLDAACRRVDVNDALVEPYSDLRRALAWPDCDRQQAVRYADELVDWIEQQLEQLSTQAAVKEYSVGAGVASVSMPPKNFPPIDLIETAERCLSAAQSSGAGVVKSLEIY